MHIRVKRGLDVPIAGVPDQALHESSAVRTVGLLGSEYGGLKPSLLVEPGSRVRRGEAVVRDRQQPLVQITSPVAGVVEDVHRGPRRELHSIVIRIEGDDEIDFGAHAASSLDALGRNDVEAKLLESGLWTALRTRPYSHVPQPGSVPAAIFVTAIDTHPLAPDPMVAIDASRQAFADGQRVLTRLTEGPVFVCRAMGAAVPVLEHERIQSAEFSGPHPAGLPGTHIHFLMPVGAGRVVWHVGYQDVIAIGKLFTTGRLASERVVAIGGPVVREPRLVRTVLGASTEDLLRGELASCECRVVSGSVLAGHRAADWSAYLGRFHQQVTVLPEGRQRELLGWILPGRNRFSATNAFISSLTRGRRFPLTTSYNGSPRAMVPIGSYERVMPLDILPTQLLRALVVGDTDAAQALGCLELDEEDLALCTFVCPGKYDYGPVLRSALQRIEKEG
ncbi:MAG TPA: Na(+)-translocating NADH-quinone reductase subunit A [Steroidobacteraceae bacterium]|nr:Na(+)-translocating NADH-quinone reductase subunit A [Steroidobacteraceae bacterium]